MPFVGVKSLDGKGEGRLLRGQRGVVGDVKVTCCEGVEKELSTERGTRGAEDG